MSITVKVSAHELNRNVRSITSEYENAGISTNILQIMHNHVYILLEKAGIPVVPRDDIPEDFQEALMFTISRGACSRTTDQLAQTISWEWLDI